MSRYLIIGLAAATAIVALALYLDRGARLRLDGEIQKVRTQALDENSTAVVLDFRVTNPADPPFVVREVQVFLEDQDEAVHEGMVVAETDARRLFQYYGALGQKYNDSMVVRSRVESKETVDRMIAARFELPLDRVESRKHLRIRITDIDRYVSELTESRSKP